MLYSIWICAIQERILLLYKYLFLPNSFFNTPKVQTLINSYDNNYVYFEIWIKNNYLSHILVRLEAIWIDVSYRHIVVDTICKDRMCQWKSNINRAFSALQSVILKRPCTFSSLHSGCTKWNSGWKKRQGIGRNEKSLRSNVE